MLDQRHHLVDSVDPFSDVSMVSTVHRSGPGPVEGTFGRRSERIARYRVDPGHSVKVTTFKPTTRKQRKERGLTKAKAYEKAWAEIQDPNFRP